MNEFFSFCKLQLLDIVHSLSYVNEVSSCLAYKVRFLLLSSYLPSNYR